MAAALHGNVASAIGQQVEQVILMAKKDSEARVRHELSVARTQLQHMEGLITELHTRVTRAARANAPGAGDPSQTVDRAYLSEKIAQLEQKLGSEVKALKQDLHRTILAHNHNSDLMRHHRDALDEARRKLDAQTQPKAEQVDAQIDKVDRMLRAGLAKQRAIDGLTDRLTQLEQQVNEMLPNMPLPGGYPGMIPGMPGTNLSAMMPPGMSPHEAAPKRGAKKDAVPMDEEVLSRILMARSGAAAGGGADGGSFNPEAPEFVPGGAFTKADGAGKEEGKDSDGPTSLQAGQPAAGSGDDDEGEAAGRGDEAAPVILDSPPGIDPPAAARAPSPPPDGPPPPPTEAVPPPPAPGLLVPPAASPPGPDAAKDDDVDVD